MTKCALKDCKRDDIEIYYYGKPICCHHWKLHCISKKKFNLKERLKVKDYTQLTL